DDVEVPQQLHHLLPRVERHPGLRRVPVVVHAPKIAAKESAWREGGQETGEHRLERRGLEKRERELGIDEDILVSPEIEPLERRLNDGQAIISDGQETPDRGGLGVDSGDMETTSK